MGEKVTIRDYVKKWEPMLKGLTECEAEFTAWAMEKEARYLNDDVADPDATFGAATMKYFFPVLRRAAPAYATGEMPEFEAVLDHLREEAATITDAILMDPHAEIPSPTEINNIFPGMAERLQGAIKSFKDAPR